MIDVCLESIRKVNICTGYINHNYELIKCTISCNNKLLNNIICKSCIKKTRLSLFKYYDFIHFDTKIDNRNEENYNIFLYKYKNILYKNMWYIKKYMSNFIKFNNNITQCIFSFIKLPNNFINLIKSNYYLDKIDRTIYTCHGAIVDYIIDNNSDVILYNSKCLLTPKANKHLCNECFNYSIKIINKIVKKYQYSSLRFNNINILQVGKYFRISDPIIMYNDFKKSIYYDFLKSLYITWITLVYNHKIIYNI